MTDEVEEGPTELPVTTSTTKNIDDSPTTKWYFGKPDPSLQLYKCDASNYDELLSMMPPTINPIHNWNPDSFGKAQPQPDDVLTWFRDDEHIAFYGSIVGDKNKQPMTYSELHQQINGFRPYIVDDGEGGHKNSTGVGVVALLLPPCYMGEMAVVMMTLLAQTHICVAPIDPNMAQPKIIAAIEQLQCSALVTTKELYDAAIDTSTELNDTFTDVRLVESSKTKPVVGAVDWTIIKQEPLREVPINDDDGMDNELPSLLLRTSGTTSTPKVVPITASSVLYNATCLAASLELKPDDVGCNVMPLFHIGGISCGLLSVLVSGSSVVMVPGPFDSHAFVQNIVTTETKQQPTWYYGVPSMHKAIALTAKAQKAVSHVPNRLRFIRSGAAHLPHGSAVELAEVFQTKVMPTYSMSECMPVCSCHDLPVPRTAAATLTVDEDTVGVPIGSSLAILDEAGRILPYGAVGEVCLIGPGVIQGYIGIPKDESHSPDGWFRTGDMGQMDTKGRLTLSGRSKEMIKRGGDQIWPNEVDSIVEQVPGVQVAVTFGVPNELWGEEVQVAVVLKDSHKDIDKLTMVTSIVGACTKALGSAAAPSQVLFVTSSNHLLKGSTGKYLRTKMADHLGAKPVDTRALNALQAMANVAQPPVDKKWTQPSQALNGIRFLTACMVVHHHAGLMPSRAWLKIQSYSLNMTIFFLLGAFQLTTSIKNPVISNASQFIGTKIGSMHSFFIVAQVIGLASVFLFWCGDNGYIAEFEEDNSCRDWLPIYLPFFAVNMLTGMLGIFDGSTNGPAWFQSVFYTFLIVFPVLDNHLRNRSNGYKTFVFILNLAIASLLMSFSFGLLGELGILFNFRFVSWMPALVAAMIAGYWFGDYASLDYDEDNNREGPDDIERSEQPAPKKTCLQRPWLWGVVTDAVSVLFVLFELLVVADPGCVSMLQDNFERSRPGEDIPDNTFDIDDRTYVTVCDVSYDEFVEYVHGEDRDLNSGRWGTAVGGILGFLRLATPWVMLWIFGLAYGKGLTAYLMSSRVMQFLSPYAYPLYLLHVPIARFYWVATRGHEAEFWWPEGAGYPFPVEWYEVIVIIVICLVLAAFLDRFIVKYLTPYTIKGGIAAFNGLSRCCCLCYANQDDGDELPLGERSTINQVKHLIKGLTGSQSVERSTNLRELGLDSLGATALLGTLRASVPCAKSLTLTQLASCDTVGDLVSVLEGSVRSEGQSTSNSNKNGDASATEVLHV